MNKAKYWDHIYETKNDKQISWMQLRPEISLRFIRSFHLPKTARIIDVGGGDSRLVDCLLKEGYNDITVLDISAKALNKARTRLGRKAEKVKWIAADIKDYRPQRVFDLWHDRATFHFLTTNEEISAYLDTARKSIDGFMTIGTFSTSGPLQCSGLNVNRYDEKLLEQKLNDGFKKLKCITDDHVTPFKTIQNFLFCSFRRVKPGN